MQWIIMVICPCAVGLWTCMDVGGEICHRMEVILVRDSKQPVGIAHCEHCAT